MYAQRSCDGFPFGHYRSAIPVARFATRMEVSELLQLSQVCQQRLTLVFVYEPAIKVGAIR